MDSAQPDRRRHDEQHDDGREGGPRRKDTEVVGVHGERQDAREGNAHVVERTCARTARDAEELPRAHRADDGEQRRQWRSSRNHDPEREWRGDDRNEDPLAKLAHARCLIRRDADVRLP